MLGLVIGVVIDLEKKIVGSLALTIGANTRLGWPIKFEWNKNPTYSSYHCPTYNEMIVMTKQKGCKKRVNAMHYAKNKIKIIFTKLGYDRGTIIPYPTIEAQRVVFKCI